MCGYMWATEWLQVEYELQSKCMASVWLRDGYMLVTCWRHVICMMEKLKFNYIMTEVQSSRISFSDKELFLFNLLFTHYTNKFHSEYEA